MPGKARGDRDDYDIGLEEGLELYEQASESAHKALADLGILPREEPPTYRGEVYDGRLPDDVSRMSMTELAELLGVTTQWADYVGGLHQMFVAAKRNYSERLAMAKAKIRKVKSGPKADKDDDTLCDIRYVEVNSKFVEISEKADITEHVSAAARRDREFISRTITALQAQLEAGTRNDSVARQLAPGDRLRKRGKVGGR